MKDLYIDGHFIEVTDEVFTVYMKGQRKMKYFENDLKEEHEIKDKDGNVKKIIPSREDSFDRLSDDNSVQFSDNSENVEKEGEKNIYIEKLQIALKQLTLKELEIITMVFFKCMTEREIADLLCISQAAVNKKKKRILNKLKKIIEK